MSRHILQHYIIYNFVKMTCRYIFIIIFQASHFNMQGYRCVFMWQLKVGCSYCQVPFISNPLLTNAFSHDASQKTKVTDRDPNMRKSNTGQTVMESQYNTVFMVRFTESPHLKHHKVTGQNIRRLFHVSHCLEIEFGPHQGTVLTVTAS